MLLCIPKSPCVGLMLGAGFARRFGSDKRKAALHNGFGLLASSLQTARGVLGEVWLVLRGDDELEALGLGEHEHVIRCQEAEEGMGCSLACGVRSLAQTTSADALVILLGDMPWIRSGTLVFLLSAADADRIVVPIHGGRRGHPVIFGRRFWPELMSLAGDQGARAILERYPDALVELDVDDPGVVLDVDTPEALIADPTTRP